MDRDETQPESIGTTERMKTLAAATTDATKHASQGEHETDHAASLTVPLADAQQIIESWPDAPKNGARQMLDHYGPPNEATPTKLFWYRAAPWKRIEVTSDVIVHNFPAPHSDYLTQYIDYQVPTELFDDIGRFDGSCLVDRTAGEAAARCDSEAANTLTLNLMHEIVTGKRTVEDARETYAQNMIGYTMGREAPYAERLLFDVADGGTEDPDQPNAGGAMVGQTVGKMKDVFTGGEEVTDRRTG